MKILSKWKRFLAVGCSHGHLANPRAISWALKFKKEFEPHTTMHLGDFVDLAALRSGAAGGPDSGESIGDDFKAGTSFLRQLMPQHIFIGNHEDRLYHLQNSPNAIVAHCAGQVIGEINDIARELHARITPYDIDLGWLKLGNFLFGHGYMFNENAIRDHAETFGNCGIAHLHRVGSATGRVRVDAEAFCSGLLADISRMGYAKTKRSRLAWSAGLLHGEYCDKYCHVQLARFYEKNELD